MSDAPPPAPLARTLFGWAFAPKTAIAVNAALALAGAACVGLEFAMARDNYAALDVLPGAFAGVAFVTVLAAALISRGLARRSGRKEGGDGDRS
ncbi:MAG: hypothetical protein AB7M12_12485 [Hyphomonadaceae bacterium]